MAPLRSFRHLSKPLPRVRCSDPLFQQALLRRSLSLSRSTVMEPPTKGTCTEPSCSTLGALREQLCRDSGLRQRLFAGVDTGSLGEAMDVLDGVRSITEIARIKGVRVDVVSRSLRRTWRMLKRAFVAQLVLESFLLTKTSFTLDPETGLQVSDAGTDLVWARGTVLHCDQLPDFPTCLAFVERNKRRLFGRNGAFLHGSRADGRWHLTIVQGPPVSVVNVDAAGAGR